MLRAVRFSAQLNFSIAKETLWGIKQCSGLCRQLSVERIRDELEKTILSPYPQKLAQMAALGLLAHFGIAQAQDCSLLAAVSPQRAVRWSAAMVCYPQLRPNVLRLDKQTQKVAQRAAQLYLTPFDRIACKTVIAAEGETVGECYAELYGKRMVFDEILASGECISLRQLAVNGRDLHDCPPKQIGAVLHRLLQLVLEHPENNRRDILLQQYEEMKK